MDVVAPALALSVESQAMTKRSDDRKAQPDNFAWFWISRFISFASKPGLTVIMSGVLSRHSSIVRYKAI